MKILYDGLSTYARPGYKQFCKQIGNNIRLVICLFVLTFLGKVSESSAPTGALQEKSLRVLTGNRFKRKSTEYYCWHYIIWSMAQAIIITGTIAFFDLLIRTQSKLCLLWDKFLLLSLPRSDNTLTADQIRDLPNPIDKRITHVSSDSKAFSAGLWQFLVDLPYDCVSEDCRIRCEFMIRCNKKLTLSEIYSIPRTELPAKIKACGLKERIEAIQSMDAVFLVNALSTLLSYSHNDPSAFLKELIDVSSNLLQP